MPKISTEQVQGEVQRFWNAFSTKASETLAEFYAPESTVFGSTTTRPEPGRLAAARRHREYFHAKSTINVVLGPIDVVLIGDIGAVASYTFQFHASKVASSLSEAVEEDIRNGRVSHVFCLDARGKLRIVHEHISAIEKGH